MFSLRFNGFSCRAKLGVVLWLSSDKASFVTGSYYPVDGGYLAQ